jgi:hypothetical protein
MELPNPDHTPAASAASPSIIQQAYAPSQTSADPSQCPTRRNLILNNSKTLPEVGVEEPGEGKEGGVAADIIVLTTCTDYSLVYIKL